MLFWQHPEPALQHGLCLHRARIPNRQSIRSSRIQLKEGLFASGYARMPGPADPHLGVEVDAHSSIWYGRTLLEGETVYVNIVLEPDSLGVWVETRVLAKTMAESA